MSNTPSGPAERPETGTRQEAAGDGNGGRAVAARQERLVAGARRLVEASVSGSGRVAPEEAGLAETVGDAARRLFRSATGLVGDLLGGGKAAGEPSPAPVPASPIPPRAPSEAPITSHTLTGGGPHDDGSVYAVLAALVPFATLLQGGKVCWPDWISRRPGSVLLSAAERPG